MKFIINGQVIFDPDAGTLSLLNDVDDPVQISNPAKRLFLLLITHQGEVVSREIIFKKVWDDFGMVSSNNNLNQCISKLRRIIKNFGVDEEIIATVPKMGFMLRQQIRLEVLPEAALQEDAADYATPAQDDTLIVQPATLFTPPVTRATPARHRVRERWLWGGLFVLAVALAFISGSWFKTLAAERKEIFLGNAGTCKVMMSKSIFRDRDEKALRAGVLNYAQKLSPHCASDEYILVIKNSALKNWIADISRLYLLRCGNMRESKAEICWSFEESAMSTQTGRPLLMHSREPKR